MSEIKPALTPEEWAEVTASSYPGHQHIYGAPDDEPYRMAALCLYGQEFGFTVEDVEGLRIMMQREGPRVHMYGSVATLADRIEALLPPEGE